MASNINFKVFTGMQLLQSKGLTQKQIELYELSPFVNAVLKEDTCLNEELVADFIANYDPVQQVSKIAENIFQVNKDALADALDLPKTFLGEVDEDHLPKVDRTKIDYTVFLNTFVVTFMYLNAGTDVVRQIHKMRRLLMKGHPDRFDFAGFMWCLVENELLQGAGIKKCCYGNHMQALIRRQHPELLLDTDDTQMDDGSEKTKHTQTQVSHVDMPDDGSEKTQHTQVSHDDTCFDDDMLSSESQKKQKSSRRRKQSAPTSSRI